ncbi:diphosphomevalonate decarboxylase [Labeo rohita]|uniref:Programmed cell death protein 5 n=1 Tax=Labeo rohita TaxID=84645 RepID=A0A498MM36_LABRO|nr:diphosphomevalonate decarboxylase [Labeo rohita]
MAVGIWTLVEKSDYISLLSSKIYAVSAYILIMAGVIVMVTGVLGCCATFKEQRRLLRVYFVLLLCIFLLEILAGVLAYIYYQQLNEELKENLRETMVQKYHQPEQEHVTKAVDKLQQEGGCITKLENFILNHLQIIGAVGVGVACVQNMNIATTLPSPLTTHVLNTAQGVPGANMTISLHHLNPISSEWNLLTTGITNDDGRCPGLITKESFIAGVYKMRFETGNYWDALGETCFYPYVEDPSSDQQGQQEAKQRETEMRNSILAQVLDQSARARLSNLALVKPDKAKAVENYLIQMARFGQLGGKITEAGLIEILEKVSQQTEKKTTVKLKTTTTIACSRNLQQDRIWLNGKEEDISNPRLQSCLQEIRRFARKRRNTGDSTSDVSSVSHKVHICSVNNFPTAAGLASSASGYACLVYTLAQLFGVEREQLSAVARQGSGSACRSLYGGFVQWKLGERSDGKDSLAEQVESESHWPELRVLVLVYRADVVVPSRMEEMIRVIRERDFPAFGELTMKDSNQFHAICLDTYPPIFYLNHISHRIISLVHRYNQYYGETRTEETNETFALGS